MYQTALVLIARNEELLIGRCLDSVRPWVDQMLVLDTGSNDNTVRLALQAGARVEHFAWVDDFAAARNHALDLAQSDWNLVIDADEWVKEGGCELAKLRELDPDFVGSVRVDNDFRDDGRDALASSWISRVLPRGVRYGGRIHEQAVHRLMVRKLDLYLGHSGYLPQNLAKKQGRNAALLERALQDTPDNGYLLYQLGKDHSVYQRYADAAERFAQADQTLASNSAVAHDVFIRWLFALKKCGRFEQAVQLAESRMSRWEGSPDYWFVVGDLLLDWACEQPERGASLIPMMEACWQRCLEIGERPDLEGSVRGRGSYLAAANLAVVYEQSGRLDEAQRYRQQAENGSAR